jgi:hypothetical protein
MAYYILVDDLAVLVRFSKFNQPLLDYLRMALTFSREKAIE